MRGCSTCDQPTRDISEVCRIACRRSTSKQRLSRSIVVRHANRDERDRSRTQREIDLLREYRTRLIADVVTGKLDVREAAARLPDEVDDSETARRMTPS